MKFAVDLSKGILGEADPTELWTEIISHIPDSVLLKPNVKILSVACGHCTEAVTIAKRMMALGISKEQVCKSIWVIDKYRQFTNSAKVKYGFKNVITADFMEWETNMKFDAIVGNPPYQDGTKDGGQNKIYNQICKKALTLLTKTGIIAFVTPTSVLKQSKRFSLVNKTGLKIVDFTANDYFTVGIQICWWLIDKSYSEKDVTVKHQDGVDIQPSNIVIYDYSKIDKTFATLYETLKKVTNTPEKRMFKQNNFGPAMAKIKDSKYKHALYKIDKDTDVVTFYSSRTPYFKGKHKFSISMTKGFSDNAIAVNKLDYDVAHLCTAISDDIEVSNIKSFIFSEYFINHSRSWKEVDGYGFNYALKYLPPFDKTKMWTNDEVKAFLEGFLSA